MHDAHGDDGEGDDVGAMELAGRGEPGGRDAVELGVVDLVEPGAPREGVPGAPRV